MLCGMLERNGWNNWLGSHQGNSTKQNNVVMEKPRSYNLDMPSDRPDSNEDIMDYAYYGDLTQQTSNTGKKENLAQDRIISGYKDYMTTDPDVLVKNRFLSALTEVEEKKKNETKKEFWKTLWREPKKEFWRTTWRHQPELKGKNKTITPELKDSNEDENDLIHQNVNSKRIDSGKTTRIKLDSKEDEKDFIKDLIHQNVNSKRIDSDKITRIKPDSNEDVIENQIDSNEEIDVSGKTENLKDSHLKSKSRVKKRISNRDKKSKKFTDSNEEMKEETKVHENFDKAEWKTLWKVEEEKQDSDSKEETTKNKSSKSEILSKSRSIQILKMSEKAADSNEDIQYYLDSNEDDRDSFTYLQLKNDSRTNDKLHE